MVKVIVVFVVIVVEMVVVGGGCYGGERMVRIDPGATLIPY